MNRLDANLLSVLKPFVAARAEHFGDDVAIRLQADLQEHGKHKLPKLNRLAAVSAIVVAHPDYGAMSARFCEVDFDDPSPELRGKIREIRGEVVAWLTEYWPVILRAEAEKLFTNPAR